MDYLNDSFADILTPGAADYVDFSNEVFYGGDGGFISPGGSCDSNETTYELTVPTVEIPKEPTSIAMSTAFSASLNVGDGESDLVLVSKDAVHFFIRRNRLLKASSNQFAFLLDLYLDLSFQTPLHPIYLTEDAQTLNIVLHVIYNLSFRLYSPPLEILLQAVQTLGKYGVALDPHVHPGTALYDDIVLKMPYEPLEVYIIAAEHDLFELAQAASGFLLSLSLLSIPRLTSARLNSDYLTMLYNMHLSRTIVLQRLVSRQPEAHEPTSHCGFSEYQALKAAWSVAASGFVLGAGADVSAALIRNTLESLKFSLPCTQCQQCVQRRVSDVLLKWTTTPRTICRDYHDFFVVLSKQESESFLGASPYA
ncbi:hypothetical protein QCA50_003950 [Cerrena zonata]|uniref:BTB domain-containing protein n=1 Tax=Cerrena zonata TaxID=2478898 RepID=A0AAW0GG67_9APHY